MKWKDLRRSSNIEDFRARGGVAGSAGKMRLLIYIIRFLIGNKYGRVFLGIGVIAYFLGYNPLVLLSFLDPSLQQEKTISKPSVKENETAEFVSVVLAQSEDVWHKLFKQEGLIYKEPKLVLFRGSVNSACGYASKQIGPFYCPTDKKVYLDMSFFDDLKERHNSPGDFAQAYVVAHEVGHHVQNLLGTLRKSHTIKKSSSKTESNKVQVKVELQADCYGGIWAHYMKNYLDDGDINEALNAASAIGDDTLQKQSRGYVVPDAFTHGSSKDRMTWFKRGFEAGELNACNTGI
ncbi:zinc metallopeptidase [Sulfurimonas sp.]|nr:zinc metallopeptidase [Sulfurimonas sp.]